MITYKKESTSESNLPVLAICYDFDKTLSPDDMQAQGFIQSLNVDVNEFWRESNTLATIFSKYLFGKKLLTIGFSSHHIHIG